MSVVGATPTESNADCAEAKAIEVVPLPIVVSRVPPAAYLAVPVKVYEPGEAEDGTATSKTLVTVAPAGTAPRDTSGWRTVSSRAAEAAGIGAPGLIAIVRGELVQEQARAQRGQPAGDRVADARPSADPGDHGDPAAQRKRVSPQLIRSEFGWNHRRQFEPANPVGTNGFYRSP